VDQTVPGLMKDYVDSGKVRYAFRDFPLAALHPQAATAAEAARCAGDQGKYWDMHDKLFALQPEIKEEKYADFAKQVGLDAAKFDECMTSSRYAAAVQNDVDYGTKLGVRGTPTVVVGLSDGDQVKNPVIIRGAQPLATFKAELDKLLAPPAK
jgi:protein-disulfide isomerase